MGIEGGVVVRMHCDTIFYVEGRFGRNDMLTIILVAYYHETQQPSNDTNFENIKVAIAIQTRDIPLATCILMTVYQSQTLPYSANHIYWYHTVRLEQPQLHQTVWRSYVQY